MGDKEYATFEEAFSVAIDGDEPQTIKLLTDVETSSSFHMLIPADKEVTFDLNGHTLDYSVWDYQEGYIHNLGTLNITDSSTDKVEDSGHFNSMTFQSMGTINIYNGHFNGGNSDFKWGLYSFGPITVYNGQLGLFSAGDEVTIYDGDFKEILMYDFTSIAPDFDFNPSIDISGGTFSGAISVMSGSETPPNVDITVTGGAFTYDIREPNEDYAPGVRITDYIPDTNEYLQADGLYRIVNDIDEVITEYREVTILTDRDTLTVPSGADVIVDLDGSAVGSIENSGHLVLKDSSGMDAECATSVSNAAGGVMTISGGNYGTIISEGDTTITGGSFANDVRSYLPQGMSIVDVGDSRSTVVSSIKTEDSLAMVGGYYFTSLAKAVAYAGTNFESRIEIVQNQDYGGLGDLDLSGMTLDLCGNTLNLNYKDENPDEFEEGTTVFTGDRFTITNGGFTSYITNSDSYNGYSLHIGSDSTEVILDGIWINGSVAIGSDSEVTARDIIVRAISEDYSIRVSDRSVLNVYDADMDGSHSTGYRERFAAGDGCDITFHSGKFSYYYGVEYLEPYLDEGYCLITQGVDLVIAEGESYETLFYLHTNNPESVRVLMGQVPEFTEYIGEYENAEYCWTFEDGTVWDETTPINRDVSLYIKWSLTTPVTITVSDDAPSEGEIVTLTASCDYIDGTWAWYKDGVSLTGNTNTLSVTESGSYTARMRMSNYPQATATATVDVLFTGGTVTFTLDSDRYPVMIKNGKVSEPNAIDYTGHEGQMIEWIINGGERWNQDTIVNSGDIITGTWFTPVASIDDTYYPSIESALDAAKNGETVVIVSDDAIISTAYSFTGEAILDLNGKTLRVTDGSLDIDGGSLEITNGTLEVAKNHALDLNSGALTLSGCTLNSIATDSGGIIWIYGSTDPDAERFSVLKVEDDAKIQHLGDSSIGYYAICLNGADGGHASYGVEIEMDGSILGSGISIAFYTNGTMNVTDGNVPYIYIGEGATTVGGIYAAGYAEWEIRGGQFTSSTALSIKSGVFDIYGGTFHATGDNTTPPTPNNNGSEDTGAAVSITTNKSYAQRTVVNIHDGRFISDHGYAVFEGIANDESGSAADESAAVISIKDGTFESGADADVRFDAAQNKKVIEGGTFSSDISDYCAPGFVCVGDDESGYGIEESSHTITESGQSVSVDAGDSDHVIVTSDGMNTGVTIDITFSGFTMTVLGTFQAGDYILYGTRMSAMADDMEFGFELETPGVIVDSITVTFDAGREGYEITSAMAYRLEAGGSYWALDTSFSGDIITFVTESNSEYYVDVGYEAVESPIIPPIDDDDDYVPIPPVVVDDSSDDDTVKIVACAAAAVVAAIMAAFLILGHRRD